MMNQKIIPFQQSIWRIVIACSLHAYDLTHILALAINQAGSTDREKIRDELEKIDFYQGLIKDYRPPFSPTQHEALSLEQLFMAQYDAKDNALVRVWPMPSKKKRK